MQNISLQGQRSPESEHHFKGTISFSFLVKYEGQSVSSGQKTWTIYWWYKDGAGPRCIPVPDNAELYMWEQEP